MGGISKFEAENLLSHIDFYQNKLIELEIPIPKNISTNVKSLHKNKYIVEHIEEHIKGRSLREIFSDKRVSDRKCLKLCEILLGYYIKVKNDNRNISIDPPLSNFILSKGDFKHPKVYYVDFMPPRQQTLDRWIVEYPGPKDSDLQKLHHKRHFTDFHYQIVFIQMCRDRISLKREIESLFFEILNSRVMKYISTPRDVNQMFNLLNSAEVYNIDYIRNIALEMWYQNIITKTDFFAVYNQTHIEEGSGKLPENNDLDDVVRFLLNKLNK